MKLHPEEVAHILAILVFIVLMLGASAAIRSIEFDTREGTLACDGAKSIMVNDVIYCKKAEGESEE